MQVRAAHNLSGIISDLQLAFALHDYPTMFENWEAATDRLGSASRQYVERIDELVESHAAP